jgi:uncharacterized membrane protein YhaH (DUF805 family)
MKSAIIDGLHRWKDFSGRSSRPQLWWFGLFYYLVVIGSQSVPALAMLAEPDGLLGFLFFALTFVWMLLIPSVIAVQVRRMHDVGKSGWFILVPIYSLYLYVQPSAKE